MSIYEFLSRLEADPFDPDIIKLFDEEAAQHAAEAKGPSLKTRLERSRA